MSDVAELILAIAALIGSVCGGIATVVTALRRVSPQESTRAASSAVSAADEEQTARIEQLQQQLEQLRTEQDGQDG